MKLGRMSAFISGLLDHYWVITEKQNAKLQPTIKSYNSLPNNKPKKPGWRRKKVMRKLFSVVKALPIKSQNRMQRKKFIWTTLNDFQGQRFLVLSKQMSEQAKENILFWIKDFTLDVLHV